MRKYWWVVAEDGHWLTRHTHRDGTPCHCTVKSRCNPRMKRIFQGDRWKRRCKSEKEAEFWLDFYQSHLQFANYSLRILSPHQPSQ